MSDTLYIQTEENVEVHHPHVYLPGYCQAFLQQFQNTKQTACHACSKPSA